MVKNITLEDKTWKNLWKQRMKYGFRTHNSFIAALLKICKQFKPELKEIKR